MIAAPPPEATSNELADWLELGALFSPTGAVPTRSVNRNLEIAEDTEPDEMDDENLVQEQRLAQVIAAIEERTVVTGQAYPFKVDDAGDTLRLHPEPPTPGGYAYLLCLIMSASAPDGFLDDDHVRPNLQPARDLFQVCATLASAGFAQGPAFSLGWPRVDATPFLEKLQKIYARLGDGIVHENFPVGMPAQVKDDAIDVVAWREERGMRPPTGYFLGQAASGEDWTEKSLKGVVDRYHASWFQKQPASTPTLATIMPFYLVSSADAEGHLSQEEIQARLHRTQAEHSTILHRHRVAKFVEDALGLFAGGVGPIERITGLLGVREYVDAYRARIAALAHTP